MALTFQAVQAQELDEYLDAETLQFAQGYDKRLRYTPSTVIVFDRDKIELSGALNLAELLERVVGIHVSRKSFGSSADQFVRGLEANLLILHNGVEIAKLLPELLAMPLIDVERVEVVKGSHYPFYGASAVVGTVNVVTRGTERDEVAAGVRGGTLDTTQVWLRRSDKREKYGYSGYLSHTQTDTTEGVIAEDRQTPIDQAIGTSASLAPGEGNFEAEITDGRFSLEVGEAWTLHQYINHRELGTGVGLAQAIDPTGEERVTRYTADARYERDVAKGSFEGRVTYNWTQAEYVNTRLLPPGTLGGAFPDGVLQSYGQTGQELFVEAVYRTTVGRNKMGVGVGGSRGKVVNDFDRRNYTFVPGGDLPMPTGAVMDFGDTAPLFSDDYEVTTTHAMFRNEFKMNDDVSFDAGARVDHSSQSGTFINPRLGVHWIAGQFTNISLLYGESAISPSEIQQTSNGLFSPLGNDDLKPAKIRLLELSVDHDFRNGLSFTSNVYFYRQSDVIGIVPDASSPIGTRFENLSGREEGAGVDVVFDWQINRAVRVSVGAALKKAITDDIDNAGAPGASPYAEIDVNAFRRWKANAAVIGVWDRERGEGDERTRMDDYTLVNVTAIRPDIGLPGLDLSIGVQNLFDDDAREDVSDAITFDLPIYPRRIHVGISYQY